MYRSQPGFLSKRLSGQNEVHATDPETKPPERKDGHASFSSLLRLLLWKNYKLLVRNKLSTVAELLLPLIFTILIVAIRFFGAETKRFDSPTIFDPFAPSIVPGTIQSCW